MDVIRISLKLENKVFFSKKKIKKLEKENVCPCLFIPQKVVEEKMRLWGMLELYINKPKSCYKIQNLRDIDIIFFFKFKAQGLLTFYRPASNYC